MSGKLTKDQMLIAAGMIDARKVSITDASTEDQIAAAAFLFDNGVFYLGQSMDEIAITLRERAAPSSPNPLPETRGGKS
jgi:hypothetical protein